MCSLANNYLGRHGEGGGCLYFRPCYQDIQKTLLIEIILENEVDIIDRVERFRHRMDNQNRSTN